MLTKRQTRAFFSAAAASSRSIFLALTVDTHRQFPTLTHEANNTPEVIAGKHVWHRKNCINCHTLLGEGAYYAPDLTKITQQRGSAVPAAFLKDPSKFYSEERDRRLMPNLKLSDQEIDQVIAFLGWVAKIDTQGWPPRPILVSGSAIPGDGGVGGAPPAAASDDPVALGQALFRTIAPRLLRLPLDRARRQPRRPLARRHRRDGGAARQGPELSRQGHRRGGVHPRVDPRAECLRRPRPDLLRRRPLAHAAGLRRSRSPRGRSTRSSPIS